MQSVSHTRIETFPKHYLFTAKALLFAFIVLLPATRVPLSDASEFTPPNSLDWLMTGDASGLFESPQLRYNITSGEQPQSEASIRFYPNGADFLKIGCLADFRLIKVAENGTFVELEYYRVHITTLSSTGMFWAALAAEPDAEYRFGVVLWNTTTGQSAGSLISKITCVFKKPNDRWTRYNLLPVLTIDKRTYFAGEVLKLTLRNPSPVKLLTGEPFSILYYDSGSWVYIPIQMTWIAIGYELSDNRTRTWDIHLLDYPLYNGKYRIVKTVWLEPHLRPELAIHLYAEFDVVGSLRPQYRFMQSTTGIIYYVVAATSSFFSLLYLLRRKEPKNAETTCVTSS